MKQLSGIYQIRTPNGKIYIGSTVDFKKRKNIHIHYLRKNKHHSRHLQNYVNKHGINELNFSLLEIVLNKEDLIQREQYYLDTLTPDFNFYKIAGSPLGCKRSNETKEKQSQLMMGHKRNLGKKQTQGHIINRISKTKGKKRTTEMKIKIGLSHRGSGKGLNNLKYIKDSITTKTQSQIAKELGIHQSTISKILKKCA